MVVILCAASRLRPRGFPHFLKVVGIMGRSVRPATTVAGDVRRSAGCMVPEDGTALFAKSTTSELFATFAIMELCTRRRLVDTGSYVLNLALHPGAGVFGEAILRAVRHTVFNHFCGGETIDDCIATARRLNSTASIRSIVDWSIEESSDPAAWDENAKRKAAIIRSAANAMGDAIAFVPLKLTALLSPAMLERMAKLPPSVLHVPVEQWRQQLSTEDCVFLEHALRRIGDVCQASLDCGVPVLVDAEQSNRQFGVHLIVRELQRKFNTGGSIVVYDTLQMYLTCSAQRLDALVTAAHAGGYTYAVKLVRGAYVESEARLGTLHVSKDATDIAYDQAARKLLRIVRECSQASTVGCHIPAVAVMLATHNRTSIIRATQEMRSLELAPNHDLVHFAQILGMVDNLTIALGLSGYNVSKLVVFGNIREVLPWLLRRMQENKAAFGAQTTEMPVLRAELWRRLRSIGS